MRFCLLALISITLIGCDKKPDSRLATPKGAAKTLYQAMYDNDVELAKKCVIEGAGQMEFAEGMTKMVTSMRGAMDAAYKQFGKEIDKLAGGSLDTMHIDPKQVDEATETINGDSATLAMKDGKTVMQLVRKDNVWKVDLVRSYSKKSSMSEQQMVQITSRMFVATARAADQTKAEIEAKKYSTPREAVQALVANMKNALQEEKSRLVQELSPR
jgi:hypothetical protein